jgi:hypothetical protein
LDDGSGVREPFCNGAVNPRAELDPDDDFELPLVGMSAGITAYVPWFTAPENPGPNGGLNTQINTYMYVRMRPADTPIA